MTTRPLRLAVPKGRLMTQALDYLVEAGVVTTLPEDVGRKLVVPLPGAEDDLGVPVELLLLKNADVPTYVQHGVAEFGVCGTDVLDESGADVFRPFAFPFGSCRIAIAGKSGTTMESLRERETLRVATKYVRIAEHHLSRRGWSLELIRLGGSVELGAVLGLADVIVDLVETGRTLRENDLDVIEVLDRTRVHLVANRALTGAFADAVGHVVARLEAHERHRG